MIHFVIYEAVKSWLVTHKLRMLTNNDDSSKTWRDFMEFMAAGALSKTIASCIAYPHGNYHLYCTDKNKVPNMIYYDLIDILEVARTRLREEGTKYRSFWQTLSIVYAEEGSRGLYRGLATQLVRQIPNTAIMMATYECVVFILSRQLQKSSNTSGKTTSSTTQFYTKSKSKGELA